jgi:serine/threonine-protein kinase
MRDEQGLPSPVVHRDICPENLFAARSGVPRIIDFGLARAEDTAGPASESGALRGRAGYAAPERIAGAAVGPATDVWGLGVVLYEMLTGEALFQGRTILGVLDAVCGGDLRPAVLRAEELDPELGHWMRRMLERDPGARMADAAALAEGLDALSRRLSPFGDAPARRLAELVGAVLDEG